MNADLRTRLASIDPARDTHGYPLADQAQLIDRILAETFTQAREPAIPPARRSHRLGWAVAAVLAVGAVVTATVGHPGTSAPQVTAAGAGPVQRLQDIARIAALQPGTTGPDADEFFYSKTVYTGSELDPDANGGKGAYGPLPAPVTRDSWAPEDVTRTGEYRENGVVTRINPQLGGASSADLSYAQIAALPTDPEKLLAQVKKNLPNADRDDENGGALNVMLGYLKTTPPPAVASALYRAASLVPGVGFEDDAVDAVGRHGVGLVYRDASHFKDIYVIDPGNAAYLGYVEYFTGPTAQPREGQKVATEALLQSGVVKRIGQLP
jgi:hypothetical protein